MYMEVVFIILLILLLNTFFIKSLYSRFKVKSEGYLWLLFTVHFILTTAYILYTTSSRSDSFNYYNKTLYTDDWFSFLKTGTKFIGFLAWPLTRTIGLGYYSVMLIFSYIGYFASVFFYLVAVENIELKHVAFSRELFAEGAIKAAIWILKKNKGLFNMQDMFGLK